MKIFTKLTIVALITLVTFVYARFFLPNHPTIDSSDSKENIQSFIKKRISMETKRLWYYIGNDSPTRGIPVKNIKALKTLDNDMEKCKENKECFVRVYDDYMYKWVTDRTRKETKAHYMIKKFGIYGEQINNAIKVFY